MSDRCRESQGAFTLVELLVAMGIFAIVGTSVLTVMLQTYRAEEATRQVRTVMDDARVSVDRIRKELRSARRVYAEVTCADPVAGCASSSTLHFWVDSDQDNLQDTSEKVTYCIQEVGTDACVDPAPGKRYELVRWTQASGATAATVIARTVVGASTPFAFNVSPPDASVVNLTFLLDVQAPRGPDNLAVDATIRLRNVAS